MAKNEHEIGAARPSVARSSSGLVALNVSLLGVLGAVTFTSGVGAQIGVGSVQNRVPGDYVIVAGETLGSTSSTIYLLDTANRELVALNWNDSVKSLEGVGYRDLVRDTSADPDR